MFALCDTKAFFVNKHISLVDCVFCDFQVTCKCVASGGFTYDACYIIPEKRAAAAANVVWNLIDINEQYKTAYF